MTECIAGCGGCCDPVIQQLTLREMQERLLIAGPFERQNTEFALQHFTQLSQAEGFRRAPWFADAQRGKLVRFQGQLIQAVFYECDMFDTETRECTAYDERPPTCRAFPWVGKTPNVDAASLPDACSFRKDLGVEPMSVDVMLARRRGGKVIA